jgi:methyl-accepting chemotaxis protein
MIIKRKRYINNMRFQMKYVITFVITALIGSFIAAFVFNVLALRELESLRWSTHIDAKTTGEIFNPVFLYVAVSSFLFVSLLIIITATWMMRKTSGQLYRMSKDIKKISNGIFDVELILRKRDEFKDVAKELNTMAARLKDKFGRVYKSYSGIPELISDTEKIPGSQETRDENFRMILSHLDNFHKELDSFHREKRKKEKTLPSHQVQ